MKEENKDNSSEENSEGFCSSDEELDPIIKLKPI